jgi:zinc protease
MKRLILLFSILGLLSSVLSAQMAKNAVRANIAGIDVIAYPTGVKNVVTLRGSLPAGDVFSQGGNPAIATLCGLMLDKGTTTQDKFAIAAQLESVGAQLSFAVDSQMTEFSGQCLRKDIGLAVSLLAEQLRTPAFHPEEFAKVKKLLAGTIKRQLESPDFRSTDTFTRAIYAPGHPNRETPPEEMLAAIESATLDEVKAFHAKHYGPAHFTLVAVGDIDVAALKGAVGTAFAGWTGGVALPAAPANTAPDVAAEQNVFMADKPSVSITLGQATNLRYTDPDTLALRVGTAILGSGFTGRLMANVRDKEGLTYGIGSQVAGDTFNGGDWRITATFAPELLQKGLESTRRQLEAWHNAGVTAGELTDRKTNMSGVFKVSLATTGGIANALLAAKHRGLDASWLDEYPRRVNALSLDQVNGAIKKHLDPEKMVLIKAGSAPDLPPAK